MSLKNTATAYGSVTKTLHWLMGTLMILMLIMGLTMGDIPNGPSTVQLKITVYGLHKSIGILILGLVFVRIGWHLYSRRPAPVESLRPIDRVGAAVMHYFLYFLMIIMPLTGWLMSSAKGRPVSFFGLFTLPDLVPADKEAGHTYAERHELIGYIIIGAATLHILAALKHHFVNKDAVLRRMLPALLCLLLLAPATAGAAESWTMLHDKSSIIFRPKQMGNDFTGRFDVFSAQIAFSADDLKNSHVSIGIQIPTAHTGDAERDENLKAKEWFDAAAYPEAKFEAGTFTAAGKDSFEARGTLTVKNISQPVTLPFTLKIDKDATGRTLATMDGHVTIDRSKFQIGTGQWADTGIIANDVPVDIHVVALGAKP